MAPRLNVDLQSGKLELLERLVEEEAKKYVSDDTCQTGASEVEAIGRILASRFHLS